MTDGRDIDLVTMLVDGVQFGVPVLTVRDVLDSPQTYPVPLAPPEIKGSINLRGRIVTAIDVRVRLGLDPRPPGARSKCVIVELSGAEPYALLVDEVGDVVSVSGKDYEPNPVTLDATWSELCRGLYRQDGALLLLMDASALLNIAPYNKGRAA
jgi:purine-binding chemotaxis protein CheW